MASAAGARAERELRVRHREAWPRNFYVYDLDEVRRTTGRTILLALVGGVIALSAEYKAVDDGPLDLADLQFQVAGDVTRPELPAYVVQFTHPQLDPPQPWAFRLWPVNDLARRHGAVELTERGYVQLHYLLSRGAVGAGGEVRTWRHRGQVVAVDTVIAPWAELAHLDDVFPDPGVWPAVVEAPARSIPRIRPAPAFLVAQYLDVHGRRLGETVDPAPVLRLPSRPAPGPVPPGPVSEARRRLAAQPVPAPVELRRTRESDDRLSRVRVQLDLAYRRLWAAEPASHDARELWRCYDANGFPRWGWAG